MEKLKPTKIFVAEIQRDVSKEVVISDESVNCYGFWVATNGIDLSQYERNPLLLWMHNRPMQGTTDEVLPLGVVENLRIEGDKLIGTPVFDEADEFALKIKSKWEKGILKMVSAGLDVIELSESQELLKEGQRYATVTKSKLREVSIVDMGANDNAIVLYNDGKVVNLAAGEELNGLMPITNNKIEDNNMKEIAVKLGLAEEATKEQILLAVGDLQESANELAGLKEQMEADRKHNVELCVEDAVKEGKFGEDKKEHFINLGNTMGIDALKETLSLMQKPAKPIDLINNKGGQAEEKKFGDYSAVELAAMKKENKEQYAKLYKEEYGIEC